MSCWFIKEHSAACSDRRQARTVTFAWTVLKKNNYQVFRACLRGAVRGRFVRLENWKEGRIFSNLSQKPDRRFPGGGVQEYFFPLFSSERFDSRFRVTRTFCCPPCRGAATVSFFFIINFFLVRGPFNSRATEGLNIPARSVCARQAGLHCERNGCGKKERLKIAHAILENYHKWCISLWSRRNPISCA